MAEEAKTRNYREWLQSLPDLEREIVQEYCQRVWDDARGQILEMAIDLEMARFSRSRKEAAKFAKYNPVYDAATQALESHFEQIDNQENMKREALDRYLKVIGHMVAHRVTPRMALKYIEHFTDKEQGK